MSARSARSFSVKLDGRITTGFYDEKATAWCQEQAALQKRINALRTTTQGYNDAIQAIEQAGTLLQQFPTQTPPKQRRLLKLVQKATWKDGGLESTLRNPFQPLQLSNHASNAKQAGNDDGGVEIKNWLPSLDTFRTFATRSAL